jgi:hypothetical protein
VEIYDNVVAWNADGISIISQDRSSAEWNRVTGNHVHHNDIFLQPRTSDTSTKFMLAWLQDWDGILYQSASNNRGNDNRYWHSEAEPSSRFEWLGVRSRLSDFNGTYGEHDGTYLTSAEKNTILGQAGVPTAP